jgi:hypothetical protein
MYAMKRLPAYLLVGLIFSFWVPDLRFEVLGFAGDKVLEEGVGRM